MALPDAFEAYLNAIYRQWYGLPAKSSRMPLEEMRTDLAHALSAAQDGAGADEIAAIYDFVTATLDLPRVKEATEAVFANRNHGIMLRGQWRPDVLSQEETAALAALLGQPHPARHAIGLQHYVPGREPATVRAVRDRLEQGITRFPDDTQRFLADIFARLDRGELSAADGLLALEQSDDVLRVAWREILAGKTEKILRTLGPAAASTPVAEAAPAASAAPDGPRVSTEYYTDVRFPQRVKVRERYPLLVRLTLNKHPDSISGDEMITLDFPDPDEPKYLDVVLTASGFNDAFTMPGTKPQRTMIVRHQQDSEPVVFWIQADEIGQKQISIDFYHDGKLVGSTRFSTEVAQTASSGTAQVTMAPEDVELELRLTNLPQPADLELRVTYDKVNKQLAYMLHSTKGDVVFHFSDMGTVTLIDDDAVAFFTDSFRFMGQIAEYEPGDLNAEEIAEFQRKIDNLGEQLFEQLLSPQLRDAYWNIKKLHEQGKVRSLLITTDEPWIPWELIRPYAFDEFSGEEEQDDFWGVTFQVSRWLNGPGPFERINVDAVSLIVPETDLIHTGSEGASFDLMRARGVQIGGPLNKKADVMNVITQGSVGLLHFATHASFKADAPDQSPVFLEDEMLTPADLDNKTIRELRKKRPIVFLNACRSGRIAFRLTGMDGWAERLVRQVRATAFIGTLWEVHDQLAAEFAAKFYSELLAGKVLGEAFHAARMHIREAAPANPTWLAYTLYGDPNTRVTWGEEGQD